MPSLIKGKRNRWQIPATVEQVTINEVVDSATPGWQEDWGMRGPLLARMNLNCLWHRQGHRRLCHDLKVPASGESLTGNAGEVAVSLRRQSSRPRSLEQCAAGSERRQIPLLPASRQENSRAPQGLDSAVSHGLKAKVLASGFARPAHKEGG